MHIESSEWNNRIFFLIVLYVITTGRAKLHAQRVQVSRAVGVLHVEDLLEEDAVRSLMRIGQVLLVDY